MKRLLALAVLALTACGLPIGNADDFREASPSRQGIDIKVPANGQALESDEVGQIQQGLLGEQAAWYKTTRTVTVVVNTATAAILKLCESIVSYEPTTVTDDTAVWGPWTDSLSPNTYKFTVTKVANGYDYVLEGKGKTEDDSAFRKLLTGHHEPGATKKQGKGTFSVDWNKAAELPEHGNEIGSADFTYERNAQMDVTVGVKFNQVADNDHPGKKVDARYAFAKKSGADGSFEFIVINGKAESFAVKSRWQDGGAGRSDVNAKTATGAVLGTIAECWGATFLETYYAESWNPNALQGKESDCVFATAEYSTL